MLLLFLTYFWNQMLNNFCPSKQCVIFGIVQPIHTPFYFSNHIVSPSLKDLLKSSSSHLWFQASAPSPLWDENYLLSLLPLFWGRKARWLSLHPEAAAFAAATPAHQLSCPCPQFQQGPPQSQPRQRVHWGLRPSLRPSGTFTLSPKLSHPNSFILFLLFAEKYFSFQYLFSCPSQLDFWKFSPPEVLTKDFCLDWTLSPFAIYIPRVFQESRLSSWFIFSIFS